MRSRTLREGSVGLLIIGGLGLFIALALWLRGFSIGTRSYKVIVEFADAAGVQVGAPVRYRGVKIGRVKTLNAGANGVALTLEISPPDVMMPKDVIVETDQSGLLGETYIDITPLKLVPSNIPLAKPTSPNCNRNLIICDKSRLSGQVGVNLNALIRSTTRLADAYSNPEFIKNLNTATKNAAIAAAEVAKLSRDFSSVSVSIKQNLNTFLASATAATKTADRTAYQFGIVATQLSNTADKYGETATKLTQLATSVNSLVVENRSTLVSTLKNFSETSASLRNSVSSLTPTIQKFGSTFDKVNVDKLMRNLEDLTANAAQASANLRDISSSLNDPKNVLLLQQTLDSARATFQNTQKITSDLDDLTGDPAFRTNLRNLVNGLGKLVSSTQQLQQQVQIAEAIEPFRIATSNATLITPLTTKNYPNYPEFVQFSQYLILPHPSPSPESPEQHQLTSIPQTSNPPLVETSTLTPVQTKADK